MSEDRMSKRSAELFLLYADHTPLCTMASQFADHCKCELTKYLDEAQSIRKTDAAPEQADADGVAEAGDDVAFGEHADLWQKVFDLRAALEAERAAHADEKRKRKSEENLGDRLAQGLQSALRHVPVELSDLHRYADRHLAAHATRRVGRVGGAG